MNSTGRFFFPGKLRHVIGLIRSFTGFYCVVFWLHTGFDGDHQRRAEGRAVRICRALIGLEFCRVFCHQFRSVPLRMRRGRLEN